MKKGISICLLFLVLSGLGQAQARIAPAKLPTNVTGVKLESKLMRRAMPYRVILPAGYTKASGKRYPVIYLLHGLFGSSENWTTLSKLPFHAQSYNAIIVTPEGENGWYTNSPTKLENRYEDYIIKELVPEIDSKYRTNAVRSGRAI